LRRFEIVFRISLISNCINFLRYGTLQNPTLITYYAMLVDVVVGGRGGGGGAVPTGQAETDISRVTVKQTTHSAEAQVQNTRRLIGVHENKRLRLLKCIKGFGEET
jgi:hypothetical protein